MKPNCARRERILNRQTGARLLEAHALAALGDVHVAGRRFATASECFGQSLELRRLMAARLVNNACSSASKKFEP